MIMDTDEAEDNVLVTETATEPLSHWDSWGEAFAAEEIVKSRARQLAITATMEDVKALGTVHQHTSLVGILMTGVERACHHVAKMKGLTAREISNAKKSMKTNARTYAESLLRLVVALKQGDTSSHADLVAKYTGPEVSETGLILKNLSTFSTYAIDELRTSIARGSKQASLGSYPSCYPQGEIRLLRVKDDQDFRTLKNAWNSELRALKASGQEEPENMGSLLGSVLNVTGGSRYPQQAAMTDGAHASELSDGEDLQSAHTLLDSSDDGGPDTGAGNSSSRKRGRDQAMSSASSSNTYQRRRIESTADSNSALLQVSAEVQQLSVRLIAEKNARLDEDEKALLHREDEVHRKEEALAELASQLEKKKEEVDADESRIDHDFTVLRKQRDDHTERIAKDNAALESRRHQLNVDIQAHEALVARERRNSGDRQREATAAENRVTQCQRDLNEREQRLLNQQQAQDQRESQLVQQHAHQDQRESELIEREEYLDNLEAHLQEWEEDLKSRD